VRAPSGEQIELANGDQVAVVVEVGGGLRAYAAAGREILDGYGSEQIADGARGQPLLPWPNRTRDGRYEWEGRELQLTLSEPSVANAIHGLVRWRNWIARERSDAAVTMTHVLHASLGYPWTLELELRYELLDEGLVVSSRATNAGASPAPFGIGFHPYLRGPDTETVDGCTLSLPAATRLVADERSIPVSSEPVEGTAFDFREAGAIGDLALDHCFTDIDRGADGIGRVTLAGLAAQTTLWFDAAYTYVMVYSGDTLASAARRRGLAVEPMSCAPNALQSGAGLVALEPGDTHTARWGISPS
jgi:aldose 1-epimerase